MRAHMERSWMRLRAGWLRVVLGLWFVGALWATGCSLVPEDGREVAAARFWSGFGPVLPHEGFPADCGLCHVGADWHTLVEDFEFDHALETGTALRGAHADAACLLCHNDRGPVRVFQDQGCAGCHADPHQGVLSASCTDCHSEVQWLDARVGRGLAELERQHRALGFPLTGAHAFASCTACHAGADAALFAPTSRTCVGCHSSDLANATNPNHIALGWTQRCDQCHQPFTWQAAEL